MASELTAEDVIRMAREKWPKTVCIILEEPSIHWTPEKGRFYYPHDAKVWFSAYRHNEIKSDCAYLQGTFDSLLALAAKIRGTNE